MSRFAHRLTALARGLRLVHDDMDVLETRSRERGEGRTYLSLQELRYELREQLDEAHDLADDAAALDEGAAS